MNNDRKEVGIGHMFYVLSSPRWITLMFVLPLLVVAHFALAQTTDPVTVKFDHVQTGFNLTGSHAQARCGSCHIQGVFKGTPRDCASCHIPGNRMGAMAKPSTHIPTSAKCDSCHKTTVWTDATFSHVGLAPGSCLTCHNGTTATGIPSGHVPSAGSCDNCHKTTIGWQQVVFSHTGIVSGCASCHNGQVFAGVAPVSKTSFPTHIATSADCSTCHTSTVTFSGASGGTTLPANHLPTTQACSTCHTSFGVNSGVMSHTGIVSGCASCHGGQSFTGVTPVSKPVNHLPTSAACETCHSASKFTAFSGTAMIHTGILSGCASCHNGQSFAGVTPVSKPVNHLPTSAACETCHSASKFTAFSGTAMSHTGIVSGCASCHNGQVFAGVAPVSKTSFPTHIATSADCSTCHTSTVTFSGASGGTTLPANHLPTTQACSTCHTSFGVNSGVMSHTGIVSGCASCHNGQVFAGVTPVSKPVNHLPTSAACETCHSASKFTAFSGTAMIHTGILSGCASCHNGQSFAGVAPVSKPVNHLPTSAACETCHSASKFTAFSGTAMSHMGIVSGCASCHNGQIFAGVAPVSKPVNHLPTSAACETCHSASKFTAFSGTQMSHVGIVNGCVSCHNGQVFAGVTPVSKQTNHLVTSVDCSSCHTSTTTFLGASGGTTLPAGHLPTTKACSTCHNSANFVPGVMNHTGILSGCASCHNGQAFTGVTPVSKPSNHIPYAANLLGGAGMACEFCHTPTVFTSFTALVSSTTMHNNSQGNGSGWCKACHASGTSYLGVTGGKKSVTHQSSTGTDCSQSGCHRPLGSKGSSYTNWD